MQEAPIPEVGYAKMPAPGDQGKGQILRKSLGGGHGRSAGFSSFLLFLLGSVFFLCGTEDLTQDIHNELQGQPFQTFKFSDRVSLNGPAWAQSCAPSASASHSAVSTGVHHHTWLGMQFSALARCLYVSGCFYSVEQCTEGAFMCPIPGAEPGAAA